MAEPVSGPILHIAEGQFTSLQRQRYRQKMPIDRPLPYVMNLYEGRDLASGANVNGSYALDPIKFTSWGPGSMSDYSRHYQHAYNRAYEKLRSAVSDKAGWGENLAQMEKSAEMVGDRLVQMGRFLGHLKKGNFGKAASTLKMPKPKKVSPKKALASNFLEYSYGWAPLMSDISSSINILASDPGSRRVKGSASDWWMDDISDSGSDSSGSWNTLTRQSAKITVTARATVRVTNPNLFLANSMGLIDPALPWKLLPFSFVVDWFVNVEQFLGSMTTWLGVELTHPHYTVFAKGMHTYQSHTYYWENYPGLGPQLSSAHLQRRVDAVEVSRVMGLPSPDLVVRPFEGFSVQRGLQAVALILSVFGK